MVGWYRAQTWGGPADPLHAENRRPSGGVGGKGGGASGGGGLPSSEPGVSEDPPREPLVPTVSVPGLGFPAPCLPHALLSRPPAGRAPRAASLQCYGSEPTDVQSKKQSPKFDRRSPKAMPHQLEVLGATGCLRAARGLPQPMEGAHRLSSA